MPDLSWLFSYTFWAVWIAGERVSGRSLEVKVSMRSRNCSQFLGLLMMRSLSVFISDFVRSGWKQYRRNNCIAFSEIIDA